MIVILFHCAIKKIGGVDSENYVILVAFSQGGQELHHALQYLTPKEKARLVIGAFGTATFINDPDVAYCHNFIHTKDPIPFVADTINYVKAGFGLLTNVSFISGPESIFGAHRFENDTYQRGLEYFHDDLIEMRIIK